MSTDLAGEMRDGGRRLLRRAKYLVGEYPAGLPALARLTPEGPDRVVRRDTDLVVEGFPRSGTTFTVFGLRQANPGISIASHIHHIGQIKKAVRLHRPTLIVVREPLACLSSYLLAGPHGRHEGILREYVGYHTAVSRLLDDIAVVRFESVTTDLGAVTAAVNRRFDLALRQFSNSAEDVQAVFGAIDAKHREHRGASSHEYGVARPESGREVDRQQALAGFDDQGLARLIAEAATVHQRLVDVSLL